MYPPFVEILSARVVLVFPHSWSRFHGVALLVTGSVLSSPPDGCASVKADWFRRVERSLLQRRCARPISLRRWAKRMYTVSGLRNGGSDLRTSPERRHRRL
ncbi:hypothetical protein Bca4012_079801 [Brassica carinata]